MNLLFDSPADVAAWHNQRREVVSASDTPKLLGLSPYGDALSVYCEKVCPPPVPDEPTDEQLAGLAFEEGIAKLWDRRVRMAFSPGGFFQDHVHPFLGATPDFLTTAYRRPLQIKKVSYRLAHLWGESGTDEVPESVAVQVQQEALVMRADRAYVAAFIGESELRTYEVPASPAIQDVIVETARHFWEAHVVPRRPPDPEWSNPLTVELLNRLHRPQPGIEVTLPESLAVDLALYQSFGDTVAEAKAEQQTAKARIIYAMGEAAVGRLGGWRVTRKVVARKGYTVEPTEYLDLRVYEPKAQPV